MYQLCQTALTEAPAEYWAFRVHLFGWMSRPEGPAVTEALRHRAPLALPAVVACGAHAPSVMVQESTRRLARLLPGSTMTYIPDSGTGWMLEGVSQTEAVGALVSDSIRLAEWTTRLQEFTGAVFADAQTGSAWDLAPRRADAPSLVQTLVACRLVAEERVEVEPRADVLATYFAEICACEA